MALRPEDFYGRPGKSWKGTLRRFIRFVVDDYLNLQVAGPGQRQHGGRGGRAIVSEPPAPNFRGAFFVSLNTTDRVATVGIGRVNGRVPTIRGITLDGKDAATGKPSREGVPKVFVTGEPGPDGVSFVCLAVLGNGDSGAIEETGDDTLTVVHLPEIDPGAAVDLLGWDGALAAVHPIAEIEWDAARRTPVRKRQMLFFDQAYELRPASGDRPPRHRFGPVS